ncbi:putative bifunctional diguanylate cyclase/phosphodiesterase [Mycolicibacterium sediminis]|uniref:GGDEF-domain containing protein n=1 Tax=Mycolicibacterium sediminis TaxID=1286180 RepID=A0A7I7QS20_9MYCO|nr:EAL domain-containing protein [Mycolicibacterium sediminis]BBY29022.1 GGDEF-domain containing protein [Mycolicibacterium sediminis]
MSRSRLHLALAVCGLAFAVFAAWLIGGWGGPSTVAAVSDVGSVAAGVTAATFAAVTAWRCRGRQRRAWAALTVALTAWFFGDMVWAYYELVLGVGTTPFPSPADAGYLIFPVAACVALVLLPIGTVGQSQPRLLLDGLMVGVSLFVIFWTLGLEAVFHRGDDSLFAFAVSVAYPIADLVLLTVAALILTRARSGQRAVVTVLTLAMGVMAVADGTFVLVNADDDYVSGGLIDVGWAAGLLLLAVAAMLGSRSSHIEFGLARAPSRVAFWLPYVPLPVAIVCIVLSEGSATLVVASMLLVIGVVVRQFLMAEENRRLLATVADQAFRDPLTRLANRALFQDRLGHAVALRLRDGRRVAVLSVDLDDFKLVNDSLGHPAGDALLNAVAERIVGCVRAGDTVARVGGDEFAVLLEDGPDGPLVMAHRIFDAFDDPFPVDGHEVFMRPSVGVAGITDGDADASAETLLKQADQAMYAAKRSQHGGVATFTPDMQLIDQREVDPPTDRDFTTRRSGSAGLQLFAQLRRAIDRGELSVVYQPKFTVSTGLVEGVEALVRWEHPDRGLMMPGDFLPLARQNGLMGALTEAVIDQAARDAGGWRAAGTDVPFAVNLFPPSLTDLELPGRITRILDSGGLSSDCLTVEITEDFLLGNTRRARTVLDMLRASDIRISIDDFGSGYSALSYLRELPIDEVKLDREFIAPMLTDERAEAIVCAMIDLAHRLEMTCVAEGVEDAATAARLTEHGCDIIQGYWCSPPVAASSVLDVAPLWLTAAAGRRADRRPE